MNKMKRQFGEFKLSEEQQHNIIGYAKRGKKRHDKFRYIPVIVPSFMVLTALYIALLTLPASSLEGNLTTSLSFTVMPELPKRVLATQVFTVIALLFASHNAYFILHDTKRWDNIHVIGELRAKWTMRVHIAFVIVLIVLYGLGTIVFVEGWMYREMLFLLSVILFYVTAVLVGARNGERAQCSSCHIPIKTRQLFTKNDHITCKVCGEKKELAVQENGLFYALWFGVIGTNGLYNLLSLHIVSVALFLVVFVGLALKLAPYQVGQTKEKLTNERIASTSLAICSWVLLSISIIQFEFLNRTDVVIVGSCFLAVAGMGFAIVGIRSYSKFLNLYVVILLHVVWFVTLLFILYVKTLGYN